MAQVFHSEGPLLHHTLLSAVGLQFAASAMCYAYAPRSYFDRFVGFSVLFIFACVAGGAFLGFLARRRHPFGVALVVYGMFAFDSLFLPVSIEFIGEVVGGPRSSPQDTTTAAVLLVGWSMALLVQAGVASLMARGLPGEWRTPLWKGREEGSVIPINRAANRVS